MEIRREHCALGLELAAYLGPAQLRPSSVNPIPSGLTWIEVI
jgi:hypothetical protein